MPPTTISGPELPPSIVDQIEGLIDRLEQFGDTFAEVIEELQGILAEF